MVAEGVLRSRSWKVFPNKFVANRFSNSVLNGIDGELIVGSPVAKDVYRTTNGALQRTSGLPNAKFHVFDRYDSKETFSRRIEQMVKYYDMSNIIIVDQQTINNEIQLLQYEEKKLAEGYEGIMTRLPDSLYKFGRASSTSQELLKLKRFDDSEAEILSCYEEMENQNTPTKDAFGRTERSSHQENLVGKGTLGGFVVRDIKSGVEFSIGTGFDAIDRTSLWRIRNSIIGSVIKYKSFSIGVKDKPRHPVYLGPRSKWDLS